MHANRSIPHATVIPELAYPKVSEGIAWLAAAFGFTLRVRIGEHRAQLNAGDGAVVVVEPRDGLGERSRILLRVEDVDAHCERARGAGAKVLREPATCEYGERQYICEDFAGHRWTFSQTVADVDPVDWGGTLV